MTDQEENLLLRRLVAKCLGAMRDHLETSQYTDHLSEVTGEIRESYETLVEEWAHLTHDSREE